MLKKTLLACLLFSTISSVYAMHVRPDSQLLGIAVPEEPDPYFSYAYFEDNNH